MACHKINNTNDVIAGQKLYLTGKRAKEKLCCLSGVNPNQHSIQAFRF